MQDMKKLIDMLAKGYTPSTTELVSLIDSADSALDTYLFEQARSLAAQQFGKNIYTRGLIEISNFCVNDCYYCGIRLSQKDVSRYRLDLPTVLACCEEGYRLGFRTFVLQGGEDPYFTAERLVEIATAIKSAHPDCALTMSLGEMDASTYQALFDAGVDRYLLRHESATAEHYAQLHPENLSLSSRLACLNSLKAIGFQVGCGFMVGSPYQTTENLAADLLFIKEFQPEMIGVGPFIPAHDTPFAKFPQGSLSLSLRILALLRLMNPKAMIPSTTALGTIATDGRERGILAGANVVMPNLSPKSVRKAYSLYDNKISTGEEAAEGWRLLNALMEKIGYKLSVDRGDYF